MTGWRRLGFDSSSIRGVYKLALISPSLFVTAMEGPRGDFHDWEILQTPDENSVPSPAPNSPGRIIDLIGSNSSGVIRSDYFAIHNGKKSCVVDLDGGVIESGNSMSVDVVLGSRNEAGAKAVVGDEGTEISLGELGVGDWKVGEFEEKSDLGIGGDAEREMSWGGIEVSSGRADGFLSSSGAADVVRRKDRGCDELGIGDDAKSEVGLEGIGEIAGSEVEQKNSQEFLSKLSSDDGMVFDKDSERIAIERRETDDCLLNSGRDLLVAEESGVLEGGSAEGEVSDSAELSKIGSLPVPNVTAGEVNAGDGEEKTATWWKFPLEFLKFCVFRVSPVWSISIAAAVFGIAILRKRLHRMKRKSQSIPLNVSVDEKTMMEVKRKISEEIFSNVSSVRGVFRTAAKLPMGLICR
ncbi:hypothetical protein ACLOJK_025547 [Asimina triloba]